jgi:hypothetical protein
MKARSFYSILAGVVGLLLLLAVVGFSWLVSQSPLGLLRSGQETTPAAAMFVPRQAVAVVSLLVNPDQLEAFRLVVAKPEERRRARAELAQFRQSLLASTGLDYEADIQPWLGREMTLAVTTLDIDRDPANGRQPGYLLALAARDGTQAREFLQLFWQKRAIAGNDLMFEQYKGVKLIYSNSARSASQPAPQKGSKTTASNSRFSVLNSQFSSAVVGDRFVLFANDPKVLRDAINNVQAPDLNLSTASFYNTALETLTQPRIGLSFVNLPKLSTWLAEGTPQPEKTGGTDAPYQTIAIAFSLARQGLIAETALLGKDGQASTVVPSLNQPVDALQYIPADSPLVAAGTDLAQLWKGVSTDLDGYGNVSKLVNQPLKDVQSRWKIDLPQDIFNWVKGEYALALLPAPATGGEGQTGESTKRRSSKAGRKQGKVEASNFALNPPENEWVFVAQRSASGDSQPAIDKLDEIAKQQGLSVGPFDLDSQTIYAWTRLTTGSGGKSVPVTLQAEVEGVHASVGNYEIFTPSIATMDRVLKVANGSIVKGDRFKQAIAPLLEPNNGYLYLDWNTSQPILEQRFPLLKLAELVANPFFNHLQSLTLSSYGNKDGVQRGGIFIKFS